MVLKTFNVDEDTYTKFSALCKSHGMSMSKQIQMFMESVVSEEPEAKQEYLEKLDNIRKGKFIQVADFSERYG
jgi:antitoxin component of RelBE/YafQ-DinJ toxin-antitoxin module